MKINVDTLEKYPILTNAQHHAHPALGFSRLSLIDGDNPSKLHRLQRDDESDALTMGTLVHMMTYEAERVATDVAVRPMKNGRAVASNSSEYAAFELANEGRLIVSQRMMDDARDIVSAAMTTPIVVDHRKHLSLLCAERSFFWTDEETGIECKIRPDALFVTHAGGLLNEDAKTCRDPSPEEFRRDMRYQGYAKRMAWYRMGLRAVFGVDAHQCILAMGKEYRTGAVYFLTEETLDAAEAQVRDLLLAYAKIQHEERPFATWEKEYTLV